MILLRPKWNLAFLVVCMTFSAMLMSAAALCLTRGVCARARAVDVEIWTVDGRAARSMVPRSGDAVPATAPTRDRPGPQ